MLSLLGSLLGFGTSFVPAVFNHFKEKSEREHELKKMELQAQLIEKNISLDIKKLQAQADVEETKGLYEHDASLKGGSFVDTMRASVRPVITYTFFGLFVAIKGCALISLLGQGKLLIEALPLLWDQETSALFAAVVSFWFGGRALDKLSKKK